MKPVAFAPGSINDLRPVIGGVRHVDTSKPIAAQVLPLWGAPDEFYEADNFVAAAEPAPPAGA